MQSFAPLKFDPNPSGTAVSADFVGDNGRPEAVGDIISSVAVEHVGVDAL